MHFYFQADEIVPGSVPPTDELAKPTKWESVTDATVLSIKTGTYRNAVFEGVFLLDEDATAKQKDSEDGWKIAIVYCLWFEKRLLTRGIELKYQAEGSEILRNYSGEVVSNLSR
ncbi:hypothetical protein N9F12_01300 [Burkholderiaceae bacterium]|jgi:hypothetical protein|nr:hypothetical protein [Burkholderiaceae bacterium]